MKSDLLAQAKDGPNIPVSASAEMAVIEQLFDHVPETAFYLKDRFGRYLAVNQSLVHIIRISPSPSWFGMTQHLLDLTYFGASGGGIRLILAVPPSFSAKTGLAGAYKLLVSK